MEKLVRKTFQAVETKTVNENDRTMVVKISTATPDRSMDIVRPMGVKLVNYLTNPVVSAFHNYHEPAIGRTLEITPGPDGIVAKVEFTPKGINPVADQLFEMYKQGFMNAWSIGFMPIKYSQMAEGGFDFEEWELLEYGAVLVPDQPEALTMLRSKGIDPEKLEKESEPEAPKPEDKKDETVTPEKPKDEEIVTPAPKDEDKKEDKPEIEDKKDAEIVEKEGRVLSEKNRGLITSAVTTLKDAITAMEELLAATEPKKEIEPKAPVNDETLKFLTQLRGELRKSDKGVGLILRDLNQLLKDNKKSEEENSVTSKLSKLMKGGD